MSQSRSQSVLEAIANVLVGWVVAVTIQLICFPILGLQATVAQNALLGAIFTAVSLVRSYLLRRAFARWGG